MRKGLTHETAGGMRSSRAGCDVNGVQRRPGRLLREGPAELARRAAAIGRDATELWVNGLAGTPSEIVDKIGTFASAGASTLYLQVLDLSDLGHLELLASEVLPQV